MWRSIPILLLLLAPLPAAADSALLGPLRLRDLTPFALQRLDFLPAAAAARYPEGWAVEANASWTNTFIMSGNVMDYLAGRDDPRPLDATDFAALGALEGDAFYFDGSITVLNLSWHYGLDESLALYGIVPVYHYHGGGLDGMIERFHEKAGFSDFGRPLVARDQFQAYFRINGRETVLPAAPRETGFADPVIGLRHRGLLLGEWNVVVEVAVKLPVGARDPLFSSGHADIGAQLSLQRQWSGQGLYFSISHVMFGGSDNFGAVNRQIPGATIAWERLINESTSFLLQASMARSVFDGRTDPELAANPYQASAGIRHVDGDWHYTFALTENIVNFNNTPDIGFHLGVGVAY